jgi:hypothetical protein
MEVLVCVVVSMVWTRSITTGETSGATEATEGGTSPKRWNLSSLLELEANIIFLTGTMKQVHALMEDSTLN